MAVPRCQQPWAPPEGPDAVQLPAGVWWDAVEVAAYLGKRALAWLGPRSGAVIRDPYGLRLVWLVPPGSGRGWEFPGYVPARVLGAGCCVMVPPAGRLRSAQTHWADADGAGRLLTDPCELWQALDTAISELFGPRRTPGAGALR